MKPPVWDLSAPTAVTIYMTGTSPLRLTDFTSYAPVYLLTFLNYVVKLMTTFEDNEMCYSVCSKCFSHKQVTIFIDNTQFLYRYIEHVPSCNMATRWVYAVSHNSYRLYYVLLNVFYQGYRWNNDHISFGDKNGREQLNIELDKVI